MYKIDWSTIAYKDLKKLESKEAVKILNSLNDIQGDPYAFGDPLEGTFKGKRKMRGRRLPSHLQHQRQGT
jgi:mRNA-degrading endonuclease RelE of RelBE toxin-antitoxin system